MITAEVQLILNIALKEAVRLRHDYIQCEHLLYCITHHDYGANILKNAGVNVTTLQQDIEEHLKKDFQQSTSDVDEYTPKTSVALERVINHAIEHCATSSQENCDLGDILVAMTQEKDSYPVYLLYKHGLNHYELMKVVSYPLEDEDAEAADGHSAPGAAKQNILEKYTTSLNEQARQNLIDPLIGRTEELEKLLAIFSRRKKNNPLLVGEPGVGKTAIVEGLALKIVNGEIHPFFRNFEIYSINNAALLAGTRFRGDFEERIKLLFQALQKQERVIVFIDEIHTIIGSGTAGNSQLDTANLLKPFLTKSNIRFIGATTYNEYRNHFQKDPALVRRFEKVMIEEPSAEETLKILNRLKPTYERYHNIHYTERTLKCAVELAKSYLKEKRLPDSAIDVMDIAGATVKLKHFAKIKPRVSVRDMETVVSRLANVPLKQLERDEQVMIRELEQNLKKELFGQDHAIADVVKTVKLSKSLMSDSSKPIGAFLFTGPTGVGKTELARALARLLNLKLLRLDMSEYMEGHSASKLIGAPPGYVGFNENINQLSDPVRKHPHALLLLDEIEKAHPDVLNTFLQIMDYGTLTDSNGNKVDFTHVIIVMTSNAGAAELASSLIGFGENDATFKANEKLTKSFSPEFRNRLSATIRFNFLTQQLAETIVAKFVRELNHNLKPKKVTIQLTPEALSQLAKKGFNKKSGARPLKRIITQTLKEPLIDELLFGKLVNGGTATFSINADKLVYELSE